MKRKIFVPTGRAGKRGKETILRSQRGAVIFGTVLTIALLLGGAVLPLAAQEKKPDPGPVAVYKAIVGEFSFDAQGQVMIIGFWEKEGKLYGAPQGQESEYAELVVQDLALLKFTASPSGGNVFELEFKKDEAGQIATCVLRSAEFELVGIRIKK
jgi:hypothetical protein